MSYKKSAKLSVRVPRMTRAMKHCLVGALLFGHVPAVFQASARSLRKQGLVRTSEVGNVVLTGYGRAVAFIVHDQLVSGVRRRYGVRA